MRTIAKGVLALGLLGIGAMAVATPSPVRAQGFYFSGPGVEVGVYRPRHRHRAYRYRYDDQPYGYYGRPHYRNSYRRHACPPHWEWNPRYGRCTSNYR